MSPLIEPDCVIVCAGAMPAKTHKPIKSEISSFTAHLLYLIRDASLQSDELTWQQIADADHTPP
jgi:hypothetical protein